MRLDAKKQFTQNYKFSLYPQQACTSTSDGMYAYAFSLAATVKNKRCKKSST